MNHMFILAQYRNPKRLQSFNIELFFGIIFLLIIFLVNETSVDLDNDLTLAWWRYE